MQAVCGGCAIVINGVPALACNTFVDEVTKEDLVLEQIPRGSRSYCGSQYYL